MLFRCCAAPLFSSLRLFIVGASTRVRRQQRIGQAVHLKVVGLAGAGTVEIISCCLGGIEADKIRAAGFDGMMASVSAPELGSFLLGTRGGPFL